MADSNGAPKILTRESLIPLGLAGSAIVLASAGGSWLTTNVLGQKFDVKFMQLEYAVRDVQESQDQLRTELLDGMSTWDFQLWIEQFRSRNPNTTVPDPPK